jgi:hypothetical protein
MSAVVRGLGGVCYRFRSSRVHLGMSARGEAARLIVDIIESAASESRHIVLPVELVVRGSARSIRETAP